MSLFGKKKESYGTEKFVPPPPPEPPKPKIPERPIYDWPGKAEFFGPPPGFNPPPTPKYATVPPTFKPYIKAIPVEVHILPESEYDKCPTSWYGQLKDEERKKKIPPPKPKKETQIIEVEFRVMKTVPKRLLLMYGTP